MCQNGNNLFECTEIYILAKLAECYHRIGGLVQYVM